MASPEDAPKVTVALSARMADPAAPDDMMHGKRFTHPETGQPASIVDILTSTGLLRPDASGPGSTEDDGPSRGP